MKKIPVLVTLIVSSFVAYGQVISYADEVLDFSSQYSTNAYSAQRATGAPDVYPNYEDDGNAWTSSTSGDMREFLEFSFSCPHTVNEVWIYETYTPGAVDTVYVRNPNSGNWEIVWSGSATSQPEQARIFKATFPLTLFEVSEIRLAINTPAVPGWNEIDAVAIVNTETTDLGADLVVQNLEISEAILAPGEEVTISGEVLNQGNLCAVETDLGIYLSSDEELDFRDRSFESVSIASLSAQGSEAFETTIQIPQETKPGAYYLFVKADRSEELSELDEENNLLASSEVTVTESDIDLWIVSSALELPTVGPGQSSDLVIYIENQGTSVSGQSTVKAFISEDDELTLLDHQVLEVTVGPLESEEMSEVLGSVTFPLDFDPGQYNIIIVADEERDVDETDESNNSVILQLEYESDLDLQLINFAVDPTPITQSSSLLVTFDLLNNGSSLLEADADVDFFLSEDMTRSSNDFNLGNAQLSTGLGQGADFILPANFVAGDYYVLALVDLGKKIRETNETNNTTATTVSIGQADVDLSVANLTIAAEEIQIGGSTRPELEIQNTGTVGAPFLPYMVYLSDDAAFDVQDVQIDIDNHPALAGGESITDMPFISFQGLSKSGTQYLIFRLDPNNSVQETNEDNNVFSYQIEMLPNASDLTSEDVQLSTNSLRQGEVLNISGTIINNGTQRSSSFPIRIYFSTDEVIDQEDGLLYESSLFAGILNGESQSFERSLEINPLLPLGDYYILLEIVVDDSDPINDLIILPFSLVAGEIDLVARNLALPFGSSAAAGSSINITGEIANIGSQSSEGGRFSIYFSQDDRFDLEDEQVHFQGMGTILGGETFEFDIDVQLPSDAPVGENFLFVAADSYFFIPETSDNSISDLNGGNNVTNIAITATPSEIDLVFDDAIIESSEVAVGGKVAVSGVLKNIGQTEGQEGIVRFYLSRDTELAATDILLDEIEYNELDPESQETFAITSDSEIPGYVLPNDYYILIQVDAEASSPEGEGEANNIVTLPIDIVPSTADLQALELIVDEDQPSPNSKITIEYAFQNIGEDEPPGGNFRVMLSRDEVPDGLDIEILDESFDLSGLESYVLDEEDFTIQPDQEPGEYFIILEVDYLHEVPEQDRSNNISLVPISVQDPDVDLIISDYSLDQSTFTVSEGVLVEVVTRNVGRTKADSYAIGYYLSEDEILDDSDRVEPLRLTNGQGDLESGDERSAGQRLFIEEPGDYFIIVETDYSSLILETDETNNTVSLPVTVIEGDPVQDGSLGSDLKFVGVTIDNNTVRQGRNVEITSTANNEGDASARFPRGQFNLYADEEGVDLVTFLGSSSYGTSLVPGASATRSTNLQLNVLPGDYFLIATIGDDRSVHPISVTSADVDLEILSASVPSDRMLNAGDRISTITRVTNNGSQRSKGGNVGDRLGIYFSQDDQLDSKDLPLAGTTDLPDIDPGQLESIFVSISIPSDQGFGDFYLLFVADDTDFFEETNEQNNSFIVPITIRERSIDLELLNPQLNRSEAAAGGFVDFITTVTNNGDVLKEEFTVSFFLSRDSVLSDGDVLLDDKSYDEIDPGERIVLRQDLVLPADLEVRYYHLFAKVDDQNRIPETNESNNIVEGGTVSITSTGEVDLMLENARISPSAVEPGSFISIFGAVSNAGSASASSGKIQAFLSSDNLLDAADDTLEIFGVAGGIYDVGVVPPDGSLSFSRLIALDGLTRSGDKFILIRTDPLDEIAESDESNNLSAIPILIAALEYDYASAYQSISRSRVPAGERLTATIALQNSGPNFPPSLHVEYFLSTDEAIDETDVSLLEVLNGLAFTADPRERIDKLTISSELPPGNYKVLARLDSRFEGDEIDETNNDIVLGDLEVLASDIDLQVTSLTLNNESPSAGDLLTVNFELGNAGTTKITSVGTNFYLSTDETLDEADILMDAQVLSFTNSFAASGEMELSVPIDLPAGTYYVIASVDDELMVSESDETNNLFAQAITVSAPDIDISLRNLAFSPENAIISQSISFSGFVSNTGTTQSTDFMIGVYASENETLGEEDLLLGQIPMTNVGSNGITRSFASEALSIRQLSLANYSIFFVVDEGNELIETDESNNVFVSSELLQVSTGIDLRIRSLDPLENTRTGATLAISGSVENIGIVDAISTQLDIFLSTDEVLDDDDVLLSEETIPSINAEDDEAFVASVVIPDDLEAGSYRVLFQVDALGSESEIDETNNVSVAEGELVVAPGEDLTLENVSIETEVLRTGGSLNLAGVISNIGTTAATQNALGFYLSTDTSFDSEDLLIRELTVESLSSNATLELSVEADLTLVAAGTYQLLAVADHTELVAEFDEDNNIAASELITILPGQDLVVTSIADLPESIETDEMLEVSGAVSNIGTSASAATTVTIYLSSDEQLDEEDLLVSQVELAAISEEATSTFSASITFTDLALSSYFVIVQADGLEAEAEFDETNNVLISSASFELTETPLSVNLEQEISVFPNPFTEYVVIKGANIETYQVFNYQGQLMNVQHVGTNRIDLSQLASGVYILELITDDATKIRKKIVKKN